MSTQRRIQEEPAWLLHHRPFRDSSRILDVLSRDHGRLSLVARGSRSARSKLKGILRPFLPLRLSWVIRTDMGTLTGAEINGPPLSLEGESLLSGYYINELMMNLLHRHDAQPEVFAVYGSAIRALQQDADIYGVLRRFEMEVLSLLGYALNLDHDMQTGEALVADGLYDYRPGQGPVAVVDRTVATSFSGAELEAIARQDFDDPETLRNAGRLLKRVLAWHMDGRELNSRKVLRELRRVAD